MNTSFQDHFQRLQAIHDILKHQDTTIDQAMILQKESQEHILACKDMLKHYESHINLDEPKLPSS